MLENIYFKELVGVVPVVLPVLAVLGVGDVGEDRSAHVSSSLH